MNRGRLFAQIEHIERRLERPKSVSVRSEQNPKGAAPPPVPTLRQLAQGHRARAEELFRPVLTASPSALATAEACGAA